jgi:hypothetical protein
MVVESTMLISFKEHFLFYWKMHSLVFTRPCGFSMMVLLPTFHSKFMIGSTTISGHMDQPWGWSSGLYFLLI